MSVSLPRCGACGRFFWYPRARCPHCGSDSVEMVDHPGTGLIYSFTIDRRTALGEPRVLVMVELDPPAGVRISGEVPDADDPDAIQIGAPVQMDPHTPPRHASVPAPILNRARAT